MQRELLNTDMLLLIALLVEKIKTELRIVFISSRPKQPSVCDNVASYGIECKLCKVRSTIKEVLQSSFKHLM